VECLGHLRDGKSKASLCKDGYSRVNAWNKKYQVVVAGTSEVLFVRPKEAINSELVDISSLVKPSYYERVFSNLKAAHGDDHAKGCAFEKKVASVHNYLPQRVCKMFTKTCP
jgi:hypothetical protein